MLIKMTYQMIRDLLGEILELLIFIFEELSEFPSMISEMASETRTFIKERIIRDKKPVYLRFFSVQTIYLIAAFLMFSSGNTILMYIGGACLILGILIFSCLAIYIGAEEWEADIARPLYVSLCITILIFVSWLILIMFLIK